MTNPLDLPIHQDDVDNTPTLGAYLAELLTTLLDEDEGFDSKRPFGNSGWNDAIDDALRTGGFRTNKEPNAAIVAALTSQPNPAQPVDTTEVRMTLDIGGQRHGVLATVGPAGNGPQANADALALVVGRKFAEAAEQIIVDALPAEVTR